MDFFVLFWRKPLFPTPLIPLFLANILFHLSSADKRNIRDLKQSLHKHQTSVSFLRKVIPYGLNLPPQPSCRIHLSLTNPERTQTSLVKWSIISISEASNYAPYLLQRLDSLLLSITSLTSICWGRKFFWGGEVLRLSLTLMLFLHQLTTGPSCLLSLRLKTVIFSVSCWAHRLFFFKQQTTIESFTAHIILTQICEVERTYSFSFFPPWIHCLSKYS